MPRTMLAPPDPSIVVEADTGADMQKTTKLLSYPLMDDDGLPSSYIQKVLTCVAKWRLKMHTLLSSLNELDEPPESMTQPLVLCLYSCGKPSSYSTLDPSESVITIVVPEIIDFNDDYKICCL